FLWCAQPVDLLRRRRDELEDRRRRCGVALDAATHRHVGALTMHADLAEYDPRRGGDRTCDRPQRPSSHAITVSRQHSLPPTWSEAEHEQQIDSGHLAALERMHLQRALRERRHQPEESSKSILERHGGVLASDLSLDADIDA